MSEHFHETAVCQGRPGIDPAAFRRVDVREKEFTGSAWLHVPAYGGAPQATGSAPDRTAPDAGVPAGNTKVISKASGHGVIYALGNGTMNIGGKSGKK